MTDEEATLVVTAGTSMYGLTELGDLVAGESVVVSGPGPIGLLAVAVAKALGASPVILSGTRESRLEIGRKLGADRTVNIREEQMHSIGPDSKVTLRLHSTLSRCPLLVEFGAVNLWTQALPVAFGNLI